MRNFNSVTYIEYYRRAKGLTQAELASIIGVSKHTVSAYEKGKVMPRLKTAFSISKTLGCPLENIGRFLEV